MYSYNIAKNADKKAFDRACVLIEMNVKDAEKGKLLEDVDGTLIQIYNALGRKIKVYNDTEVDAVYIDSEVDLKNII